MSIYGKWALGREVQWLGVYDDQATDTYRDQVNGHHGSGVNGYPAPRQSGYGVYG